VSRNLAKLLDIKSLRLLDNYAQFNPVPLSIEQFLAFGQRAMETESYHFLKKELPVRFANIMKEINLLPATLLQMPSVQDLQGNYADSFRDLIEFEGSSADPKNMAEFLQTLLDIEKRCSDTVRVMAQGVLELKDMHDIDKQTEASIQYFLDRFYMSRISLKMLMNQHILLFENQSCNVPDSASRMVGIIDTKCNVTNVIDIAYEEASILCEHTYTVTPEINIKTHNSSLDPPPKKGSRRTPPILMVYPQMPLKFILVELLKNSMRATVERSIERNGTLQLPPINILVSKGSNDITIKISDQGGGFPLVATNTLFNYLYSTAPRPAMKPTEMAAFAGYGYGLPLSRLYARYFHGDLKVNSIEGYGTDAIIYLKTHASDASELLPIFNKTSTKQYKASVPTADWTDPSSGMNSSIQYKFGSSGNGNGNRRSS